MSETPDHIVEVMAREFRKRQYAFDYLDEASAEHAAREHAKAALQALQDEGYIVAKPFWPPEEIERASRNG